MFYCSPVKFNHTAAPGCSPTTLRQHTEGIVIGYRIASHQIEGDYK
ncbi:MAG: hypothetical protein K2H59_09965 [Muribaculaceae bacterium]|nr:hypothetical protein [Muribaculaceae bacterium]